MQPLPPMIDIINNKNPIIMNTIATYLIHVESVESVPGCICTPPTESHLKPEGQNHV